MLVNIHNHSEFSPDAYNSVKEMCQAAENDNIKVFAITDHCDLNEMHKVDLFDRMKKSTDAINKEKKNVGVEVLTGIELGEPNENNEYAQKILDAFEFDFVIGSIHSVKGEPDFYYADYINMPDDKIYTLFKKYYEVTLKMLEWGNFDTLAHITYPYRYLNRAKKKTDREFKLDYKMFDEYVENIFSKLIKADKSLELNIGSLVNAAEDEEMENHYFKMYYAMGGRNVTVGVDAHSPEFVSYGIERGYKLLKEIGFTAVSYYKKRNRIEVPIEF